MPNLRQIFTFLLALAVGIGLLLALPHLPFLTKTEHALFLYPERFQQETFYSDHGDRKNLTLSILQIGSLDQVPLASFELDHETREILGTDQPGPAQWAYLLHSIRAKNCDLLAITAPLSWPDAEEIPLRALQHQVSQFPTFALGLVGKNTGRETALPPYLKNSLIPGNPDHFDQLPEIDQIEQPPSITAPVFGIAAIEGQVPEKIGNSALIPMLIRWGNDLLPSIQLATLIASHDLTAADVIVDPSGYLRLGKKGTILPIDSAARIKLPLAEKQTPSALTLLTSSQQSQRSLILHDQNPPAILANLEQHHYSLWPQKPTHQKTYQRWPLPLEIATLVIIALLFLRKKNILATLTIAAALTLSISKTHWLPLLPLLGIILTFLIANRKTPHRKSL